MSSVLDVKIASSTNLEKLESFFKDASYRELIEYCVNFNTRLCLERRLRLPFLDPQTGVAQNHCQLFVDKRQRMPGFRQGQIYTYPSARWRKSRRQYLSKMCRFPDRPFQALRKDHETLIVTAGQPVASGKSSPIATVAGNGGGGGGSGGVMPIADGIVNDGDFNSTFMEESSSLGAAGGDTSDSKDSQHQQNHQQSKEDHLPKDWFYDEMDINDNDSFEEPKSPADDEYDYDPRYGNKKRRKRKPGKKSQLGALVDGGTGCGSSSGTGTGRRGRGGGAGRGRGGGASISNASIPSSLSLSLAVVDSSLSGIDSLDGISSSDVSSTPTTLQGPGRRPRGGSTGRRGRRRTKITTTTATTTNAGGSNRLNSEPPSFESVAAAVGSVGGDLTGVGVNMGEDHNAELRNYRKYL